MKKIIPVSIVMILMIALTSCLFNLTKPTDDVINMKNYKGDILLGKEMDWSPEAGANYRIFTFRRNDCVWTESHVESDFSQFRIGDTIK